MTDQRLSGATPPSDATSFACACRSTGLCFFAEDAGNLASFCAGRMGRGQKPPPQLGQTFDSTVSTQLRQNVHSKVQIMASVAAAGSGLSQFSQEGRSSSMGRFLGLLRGQAG